MSDIDFAKILERAREGQAAAHGMSVEAFEAHLQAQQEQQHREHCERMRKTADSMLRARVDRHGTLRRQDREAALADNLQDTEALGHVRGWLQETQEAALMLCGGVGTGKTVAAAWAVVYAERRPLAKLVEAGSDPLCSRDRGLEDLRTSLPRTEVVPASLLARRVDPWKVDTEAGIERLDLDWPLVVLDDLGTERSDDPRFSEALFRLVDERQDQARFRTLITTNLKRADIRPRYGDRIADRLNHIGKAVEIRGESMRRKGAL